jgi:hypothetical protein
MISDRRDAGEGSEQKGSKVRKVRIKRPSIKIYTDGSSEELSTLPWYKSSTPPEEAILIDLNLSQVSNVAGQCSKPQPSASHMITGSHQHSTVHGAAKPGRAEVRCIFNLKWVHEDMTTSQVEGHL